jgi:uncharacterized protein (DUF885 family)
MIVIPDQTNEEYMKIMKMYSDKVCEILDFLKFTYYPVCRDTIGLCYLPQGKEIYKFMVKNTLTTDAYDIAYIHKLGKEEITRLSQVMRKIAVKFGYDGYSLAEFYKYMMNDKSNRFKNKIAVLAAYRKQQDKCRKHILPKYFKRSVKPYEIKVVPKAIEKTTSAAFYIPGFGRQKQGTFYINFGTLGNLANKYYVLPLSLHEGEPGHHYQFQYMIDKGLPLYKIFSMNGDALAEGWALYAETLGPDKHFGKLALELLRAARLVIDTGIHYYGWSYRRALNYMKKHVPIDDIWAAAEIERYICMPAQALCYKIGEKCILEWRDRYMQSQGSIKEFHEVLLEDGILPLQVLDKKMKKICNVGIE